MKHTRSISLVPVKAQSTTEIKTEFALDTLALLLGKFPRGGAADVGGGGGAGGGGLGGGGGGGGGFG